MEDSLCDLRRQWEEGERQWEGERRWMRWEMSTFLGLVWVAVVCSEEVVGTGVTQLSVTGEAVSGEARAPLPCLEFQLQSAPPRAS